MMTQTTPLLHFVEADVDMRDCYARLSAARGWRSQTSPTRVNCPPEVHWQAPSAIVLDSQALADGADGIYAGLRPDGDRTALPPVFLTGHDSPEVLARRWNVPRNRCFQKPFRVGRLLDAVCAELGLENSP